MLIIFQTGFNNFKLAAIITLSVVSLSQTDSLQCSQHKIITQFTRCNIQFSQCRGQNTSDRHSQPTSRYIVKKCTMKKCQKLHNGDNCSLQNVFELDQLACNWQCCKSTIFDPTNCQLYNVSIQMRTEKMDGYLLLVLFVAIIGLVAFVTFVSVSELRCLQKQDDRSAYLKGESKPVQWVPIQYQDHKCQICQRYGAIIQTTCQHYFHFQCFGAVQASKERNGAWLEIRQCPKCSKSISRIRIRCDQCQQQYIKISLRSNKSHQQVHEQYIACKQLHEDCVKDANDYLKTDVRLTQATREQPQPL